jgi:hypothetical protein
MARPPTTAQTDWMKANKNYLRTTHLRVRFAKKGTLRPDGTFLPATGRMPVMDGNGSFGVGVPMPKRRRA